MTHKVRDMRRWGVVKTYTVAIFEMTIGNPEHLKETVLYEAVRMGKKVQQTESVCGLVTKRQAQAYAKGLNEAVAPVQES